MSLRSQNEATEPLLLTTIGTGVAIPEGDRGPTCSLIELGDTRLVVDLGSGSLQKLAARGVNLLNLDALLLTHAHPDHVADLFPLLFALRIRGMERRRPLDIFVSRACHAFLEGIFAAWGRWMSPGDSQVRWHTLEPGQASTVAGFSLETAAVVHDETSIGYRLSDPAGRVLAIPGDTAPCAGLITLCRDADLAVVEGSLVQGCPLQGHLEPQDLIDLARESRLRALVVVHQYRPALVHDSVAAVIRALSIPVWAAQDGQSFVPGQV